MAQLTKFPDAQRDQMSKLNLFPCYQWLAQTLWNFLATQFETSSVILPSPNGHRWRVTVDNSGHVTTTDLG